MSSPTPGRTLSYWHDKMPVDGEQVALYARDTTKSDWLLVGVYEKAHARDIIRITYANWPTGTVYYHQLP